MDPFDERLRVAPDELKAGDVDVHQPGVIEQTGKAGPYLGVGAALSND